MSFFSKIFSYSKWTILSALVGLLLQIVLYLLIANKVDPTDLGHYFLASLMIFIPVGIIEYSFSSSLIHEEAPQAHNYTAVLFINLKMSLGLLFLGTAIVLGMSWYYEESSFIHYFLLLTPIVLLMAYSSVENAGLRKNLRMKTFSLIELVSLLISFGVTATLLLLNWGVLAIIAGKLTKFTCSTAALSRIAGYLDFSAKPSPEVRKHHWDYGQYILAEKSLTIGLTQIDSFIIHHYLGAEVLGIYDLLKRMIVRPFVIVYVAIEQVVFPLLCRPENKPNYAKVFNSFIQTNYVFFLALLGLPLTTWLMQFFPEPYQEYDHIFQLIILLAISMMVFNPVDIVAYSLDKTKRYFYWILSYSLLQLALMMIALQQGLQTFIMAMIFFNLLTYMISYFVIVDKETKVSFWSWSQLALLGLLVTISFILITN